MGNFKIIELSDKDICAAWGVDTIEEVRQLQAEEQKFWCNDENHNKHSYYVPDNKHPDVSKHHWRCPDCDKITQIG